MSRNLVHTRMYFLREIILHCLCTNCFQPLVWSLSFPGICRLVCTALYNDGEGERKYLPQFFKFIVANPLSVRTKV